MLKISMGRYSIDVSHPDKVLFPQSSITKLDLINYYRFIGPVMTNYTIGRPISMVRYPDGIGHEGFFQKEAGDYFPDWIATKRIQREDGGYTRYVIIDSVATLVYLANQGCITPHVWLSTIDNLEYPDRMIFDFDPAGTSGFGLVRKGALLYKKLLDSLGLPCFVMTTGSRGVHVIVPIKREKKFVWVRQFAQDMAQHLVALYPDVFTLAMRKKDRGNLLFLDTLRNAFGQTGVAPYAVRPKPGAPVATPITWQELQDSSLQATSYTLVTLPKRIESVGDILMGMGRKAIRLVHFRAALDKIIEKKRVE